MKGAILVPGNVIVGFAPAGTASLGGGAADPAARETSPLGLFDAMLAMLAAPDSNSRPAAEDIDPAVLAGHASLGSPKLPAGLAALLGTGPISGPAQEPAELDEAEAAFADLLDALAALGENLRSGNPPDPALDAKTAQALDRLAGLFDLPPIDAPSIDALIAAAGTVPKPGAGGAPGETPDSPAALDPLAAIASAATSTPMQGRAPETQGATGTVAPASGATAGPPTAGIAPAPPDMGPDLGPSMAAVADDPAQAAAGVEVAAPAGPVAKQLSERIATLAAALEPRAPALAKSLAALADKLASGEVKPEILAKLGIDPSTELPEEDVASALDRLLGANRDIKAAPAPQAFSNPRLALPADLVLHAESKPGAAAATSERKPVAALPPAQGDDSRPAPRSEALPGPRADAPADRADPAPAVRPSFAAALQAGIDAPDTSQPQPQAQVLPNTAVTAVTPAAGAKAVHAAHSGPARQIDMPRIAFEIVRQVEAGASRFHIRLDPPELGRVDVKLDVDAAGNVNARMTVDRAETLDLMQRDQRALERALAQAGLDGSKTNLEFSLRQNPFGRDEHGRGGNGQGAPYSAPGSGATDAENGAPAPHIIAYRGHASPGGVNLFV